MVRLALTAAALLALAGCAAAVTGESAEVAACRARYCELSARVIDRQAVYLGGRCEGVGSGPLAEWQYSALRRWQIEMRFRQSCEVLDIDRDLLCQWDSAGRD